MEGKTYKSYAIVLLTGIALCCAVMYMTADSESVLASENHIGVVSYDVMKAGKIITDTPRKGRMRLLNYLTEIKNRIATQVANRKSDIDKIRASLARNRAYNAKARRNMRRALMHRMAVNAKKAKDDLARSMAWTARTFAHQARIENMRNRANIERAAKTRARMRANKRLAANNLRMAVLNQQRSLSALAMKTNAHIARTNRNIAQNADDIRSNARKARRALANANHKFTVKMFNMSRDAKNARSKLAAASRAMNKRLRYMVASRVKSITASTSAQFKKVRSRMARDRHHADMALKHSTTKLAASLQTMKLLQNKRFASTVKNIGAMRRETARKIRAAKAYFKVNIMQLKSTVKQQVNKLNGRVSALQGTIEKNRVAQAKLNRNVNAEMNRMIALGNKREAYLAQSDKRLRHLQKRYVRATNAAMKNQARVFNQRLSVIRRQMKKNRAHAERSLSKQTAKLVSTLANNAKRQASANRALSAATRRARLDAAQNLREAKRGFAKRLAALTAVTVANDRKADRKIKRLAGIETRNAVRSANGRRMLRILAKSNKNELKNNIRNMIRKGERAALAIEKRTTKMTAKTRAALNNKIMLEVSVLSKKIHGSIADLRMENKKARALLKKQIKFAITSAAKLAKKNLKNMVSWSNKKFLALDRRLDASKRANALGQRMLKKSVAAEKKRAIRALKDAVSNQNRALLALKATTNKKIKKSNQRVDAYAKNIGKWATQVDKQMKANANTLINKVNRARLTANAQLRAARVSSIDRYKKSLRLVAKSIAKARAESKRKFGQAYEQMSKDRAAADRKVANMDRKLTNKLAKQSALFDARFRKTVKDIKAARAAASKEVADAKKEYTTAFVKIRASIRDQETRLRSEIAIVSSEFVRSKAAQREENRKVNAEIKRITKIQDARASTSKKARGRMRLLIEKYRKIAKKEKNALRMRTNRKLVGLEKHMANQERQVRSDLKKATKRVHLSLNAEQMRQARKVKSIKGKLASAMLTAKRSHAAAVRDFKSQFLTLTNTVTAARNKFKRGLRRVTAVTQSWKRSSARDRKLLRSQAKAMQQNLHRSLLSAVAIGTARAKRAEERANRNMNAVKKAMRGEMSTRIEKMANQVFKASSKERQHIANNYLALKAYCASGSSKILTYTTANSGRGMSSVGDALATIASFSGSRTKGSRGIAGGLKSIMPLFGGKKIKGDSAISRYNGLVDEYTRIMTFVRRRWPYGLGRYLLSKLEQSMQKTGALKYTKLAGKNGQHVIVNARAIGLSNRMHDFDKLAVSTQKFQASLKKLAAKLPKSLKTSSVQYAPPVWWKGN